MIVGALNQQGGVGKTTVAINRTSDAPTWANLAEPDQWVRRGDLGVAPIALAPSPQGPAAKTGFAIDLAAERDLGEVVALGVIVASLLGSFCFANAMDRYRRIFAR